MVKNEQGFWETVLRIAHITIGLAALAIAAWFLFLVRPFNPYGFGIFLVIAIILLTIGFFGSRKEVFKAFFMSGL